MKKFITLLFIISSFYSAKSQTIVISQAYGAGGNSSAPTVSFSNDFVELFNATNASVDISNWSIQYANATSATGSWGVTKIPAGTIIPSGKYFLIQMASGGTVTNSLPTADLISTTNMGSTGGRIALVSDTNKLANGFCPTQGVTCVDVLGYGTTTTCSDGSPTANLGNILAAVRKNNGCTQTHNNVNDFDVTTPNPRNSASPVNVCAPPAPYITAAPNITTLVGALGTASPAMFFNLSGALLSPAAGNITVTPTPGVEISLSSGSGFGTVALLVPYTGGSLAATPIYVRIPATAPQGVYTGDSVTCTGGTAPNAVVKISGVVYKNYFSKSTGNLDVLATWGTNAADGSGTSPLSFDSNYVFYTIKNRSTATIGAAWGVKGTGSKVIVGDGTNPTTFTLPATVGTDTIAKSTKIDVSNNAILVMQDKRMPTLNALATGSTVDYAQTGITTADTIKVPTSLTFHHLKLTNGLKYLSSGTTNVKGNFIVDGVTAFNGNPVSTFSTLNLFGNFTLQNNAKFEPDPTGDGGRITLAMNGGGPTQTITGNNSDSIFLFRLRRDTTTSNCTIVLGTGTSLVLGNNSGGGLQLTQGASTLTTLDLGSNLMSLNKGGAITAGTTGKITSTGGLGKIKISKSSGTTNAGTIRFTPNTSLSVLGLYFDPAFTRDSLLIGDSVVVANLILVKGKAVMSAGKILSVPNGGIISGGSTASFVDGKLEREMGVLSNFPVGKGNKYAPVEITPIQQFNSYTVQYFNSGYGSYVIDPATLLTAPGYNVSDKEYWTIDQAAAGIAAVKFYYTDASSSISNPALLRIAHSDLTDWDDLGGTPDPGNTTTAGSVMVNNISTFSPFTFAANISGVIPVKLNYFNGNKTTAGNNLNWQVTCLTNSVVMELERSATPNNFVRIHTIAATQIRCYAPFNYIDMQPLNGANYYRLKMIDIDGKVTYSPTVLINNLIKGIEITGLYPSLVHLNTQLSITTDKSNNTAEWIVTDMNGRLIQSGKKAILKGKNLINIDCATLAAGTYQINCIVEGVSKSIRFVKL